MSRCSKQPTTADVLEYFVRCLKELEKSEKIAFNSFVATVNALRFLMKNPNNEELACFKKQMASILNKIPALPSYEELIQDGWAKDDINVARMAVPDFEKLCLKAGVEKEEMQLGSKTISRSKNKKKWIARKSCKATDHDDEAKSAKANGHCKTSKYCVQLFPHENRQEMGNHTAKNKSVGVNKDDEASTSKRELLNQTKKSSSSNAISYPNMGAKRKLTESSSTCSPGDFAQIGDITCRAASSSISARLRKRGRSDLTT